jgi:hypothetical protein
MEAAALVSMGDVKLLALNHIAVRTPTRNFGGGDEG